MQCKEMLIELDAYLTAELDAETGVKIDQHLEQCAACRTEIERLREENARYRAYASTLRTPADAWRQIQSRLPLPTERQGSRRERQSKQRTAPSRFWPTSWQMWAAAASLLLVSGASLYVLKTIGTSGPSVPAVNQVGGQTNLQIELAVRDYQQALAVMRAAYEEKKPYLDPPLISELDRNLRLIRAAIDECHQALQKQPDSEEARQFLLLNYEKQIDTLRQITEVL